MNPFEENLSEEDIKHRKMWNKLNQQEQMNWIFNQLVFNISTGQWNDRTEVLLEALRRSVDDS